MSESYENNDLAGLDNAPAGQRPPRLNALDAWAAPVDTPVALAEVRLDASLCCLIPFTMTLEEATLHYVPFPSVRSYVHCNGDGCVLCRIGRHCDVRHLLPVYDPLRRAVGVLPVSQSIRPGALRPQLFNALKRLGNNERIVLTVQRTDTTHFEVHVSPLPDESDDGACTIKQYLESDARGEVELGAIYQRLDDKFLAQIPEVSKMLQMLGEKA